MPQFRCYRLPGLFTLRVPKETAGEHFDGLQMLTSLLAPKGSRSAKPLVEELNTGKSEVSVLQPQQISGCTFGTVIFFEVTSYCF